MIKLFPLIIVTLITSCSGLFYYPSTHIYSDPHSFDLNYEDINLVTKDGVKLHGWFFKSKIKKVKNKSLILFFHGNAQNITAHYFNLGWINNHGHDFIIFDYRGYGKSEGVPDQVGTYYDACSALDFAHKQFKKGGHEKFIVYGQSLGGAIASRALLGFPNLKDIDFLVMDSTFLSYRDVAFDKASSLWFTFLFSPLVWLATNDQMSSKEDFPKLNLPMLTIHGTADKVIPFKFGEDLYNNFSGKKVFWKIPEGVHCDVFYHGEEKKYRQKFLDFIQNF